ncbi:MAG: heavy metal translocating P-type ATPase [Burkholderiales bacterium]
METARNSFCAHCALPIGRRPDLRQVSGEARVFCCYGCAIAFQVRHGNHEEADAASFLVRLGTGAFLAMNVMMLSWLFYGDFPDLDGALPRAGILWVVWLLATPAVAILGWPFASEAWQEAKNARVGASGLAVFGVACAYLYSTFVLLRGGEEVYFDTATMVLVLFTLGRYLEAAGRARAARDLAPMLEAESRTARVGDVIRVAPGERIAVDGVIVEGRAFVDEAVISGESRRLEKSAGASVTAGSLNLDGHLLVRCEAAGGDTRWGQICLAVRSALSARSPLQGVADRISAAAVPLVLAVAAVVVAAGVSSLGFDEAMLRGVAVLVVACPCALGLAAPLAAALGVARLTRQGCIVRSGGVLESLARAHTILFDKTGTLTSGTPRLVAIQTNGVAADLLLRRAAGLEQGSGHALGRGIASAAAARGLLPLAARDARSIPGCGVVATAEDGSTAAGSAKWLAELGFQPAGGGIAEAAASHAASGFALVHVGWAGAERGLIAFEHELRPEAEATLAALRQQGIRSFVVSGDLAEATRRTADAAGADDWVSQVPPEAKAELVALLRRERGVVAMVGDGINDAMALAEADVGISIASATDLARETADLVLPRNSLALLPWAVRMAGAVRRTIVSNLVWAFGYNAVAVALAASGLLQPIGAAALMAGSSLLVIVNSLRLERFPAPEEKEAAVESGLPDVAHV